MLIRRKIAGLQRPPLGAQVDWGHRLTTNLRGCFVFNEAGGSVVTDLYDNAQYPWRNSPAWGTNGGMQTPGASGFITTSNDVGVVGAAPPRLQISPVVSIFWRGILTANPSTNAHIAGVSYTNANTSPYKAYGFQDSIGFLDGCFNSDGTSLRTWGNNTSSGVTKNREMTLAASIRSGAQVLYRNGVVDTNGSTSYTNIGYGASPQIVFGGCEPGITNRSANAVHLLFLIYNRILTPAEVAELNQEPYGFLKVSATRRYFFIEDVAVAQNLTGGIITTGESFGTGVVAGPVTGTSPIATAELFGTGSISAAYQVLGGVLSIPSGESFSPGVVAGPVSGAAAIATAESFGAGFVEYDQAVTAGATIATAEAFTTGTVAYQLSGSTIATAESFSGGFVRFGITGYDAIASAERFFRGTVYRDTGFQLFIRGIDRSRYLKVGTMEISEELDGRCSASFELETVGRSLYRPAPYDEVVYMFGGQRKFGGLVQDFEEAALDARSDLRMHVQCTDYRQLAENRTFSKVYVGPSFSAKAIIKEIFEATLRQEGIIWDEGAAEDVSVTGSRFVLNDEPVAECFDKVAAAFGMSWRITRHRVLRFERTSWEMAPRVIRDNDQHTRAMKVKRSNRLNRTRQGIRTGIPVSGQRETTLAGNGTHEYRLGYAITEAPTVEVNTVAAAVINWDDRTLLPYDFAWERNSNVLRHNASQGAYTSSDEIVVTHPSSTLDVLWVDDTAAIERLAARTGGSGIVEVVRNAQSIRDKNTALQLAYTEFEKNGGSAETLTWEEDEYLDDSARFHGKLNWAIGQIVHVMCSAPLCAGMFVVQSLKMHEVGGTFLRYQITACSKELPLITGVEVDPEERTVTITVDRPVEVGTGAPIEIWGGGGIEPIWGNPTIENPSVPGGGIDGSSGNTFTFTLPSEVDPGDLSYYGGLGGITGGTGLGPIDGTPLGTNGLEGGGEPFGGVVFSGIPPTGGPGELPGAGTGIGTESALVVINVDTGTNEVTLSRAHGWSTSYPEGSFRVAIFGVTGCDAPNGSTINNPTTRITVTGADTFIAEDVGDISGAAGFENDGHGRAIATTNIIRVTPGTSEGAGLRNFFAQGTYLSNNDIDRATFLLATAIPGVASRGLAAGTNVTNTWEAQRDISVVESVVSSFGTPPLGQSILIDIKQNGTSIFAAGSFEIPTGSDETVRITSGFRENPLVVERGDKFTVDVLQVGSEFPGCGGTVIMNTRG